MSEEEGGDFCKRSALASLAAERGLEILKWIRGRGVQLADGRVVRSITSYHKEGMELFTIKFNIKEGKRNQSIEDAWMTASPKPKPGWLSAFQIANVTGDDWYAAMEQTWAQWQGLTPMAVALKAPAEFQRGDRVEIQNYSRELDGRKGIIKGFEKKRRKGNWRVKVERKSERIFCREGQMVVIFRKKKAKR
jgi:hypothetical protein